jgi:hypothetical protein
MLHYFKRIRDDVEALPRNWVECEIFAPSGKGIEDCLPEAVTAPIVLDCLDIARVIHGYLHLCIRSCSPSEKRWDTVGEPPSAENCASHMPSLKAQEQGESEVATAALSRGNRFANSIRWFFETTHSAFIAGVGLLTARHV